MHTVRRRAAQGKKEEKSYNSLDEKIPAIEGGNLGVSDGYLLSDSGSENVSQNAESDTASQRLSGHIARRNESGIERLYWDDLLPGFGLRVYATGAKRWIVQLRQRGVTRRITLGDPADLRG